MMLSINKQLELTPWEVLCALHKAGLVDEDCCNANVQIVERTEVNEGRTVIVSWSLTQKKLELKDVA